MILSTEHFIIALFAGLSLIMLIAITNRLQKLQVRGGAFSRMEAKLDRLLEEANIKFDPFKDVPREIADALRRGEKIEAIKLYRQMHPVSLKEAKEAIEVMQARAGV